MTWLLVASTVVVFLLQLCEPPTGGDDTIARTLSFSPQKWAGNEWWTVLTYAWVHDLAPFGKPDLFWAHIVFNMIPLICMGPPLEELIGHFSFLLLYLGGAVAAALAWMYLTTSVQTDPQIIGASGAVFAVIAALGTAGPGTRVTFFFLAFPAPPDECGGGGGVRLHRGSLIASLSLRRCPHGTRGRRDFRLPLCFDLSPHFGPVVFVQLKSRRADVGCGMKLSRLLILIVPLL